jgi:hypothetical protein
MHNQCYGNQSIGQTSHPCINNSIKKDDTHLHPAKVQTQQGAKKATHRTYTSAYPLDIGKYASLHIVRNTVKSYLQKGCIYI